MGLPTAQIIDQEPGSVHLFYRDLRDVDFLLFQPAFWGEGPAVLIFRQLCLGRVALSPARGSGDGHNESWYFWALSSGGFPWQFAVPLLRVRAAVAESQPLSQNRGITGRSPLMFWPL